MSTRRRTRAGVVALATALSIASLIYLGTTFEWSEPLKAVRKAHLITLIVTTCILQFAFICVRTLRWQVVVRDTNPSATFGKLYWVTAIAVSLAIVTPGQFGEAAKVELLRRQGLGTRLAALGSFALERVLDLLALTSFCLIGLAFGSGLSARFPRLPLLVMLLFFVALVLVYFLRPSKASIGQNRWISIFRSGTGTPLIKVQMLVLTLASWCLVAAGWLVSFRAVGIDISLPAVCWVISLVTVGTLLSLIPAGVGVADVVAIQSLMALGVPQVDAQAGALILRVYAFVVIAFGLSHLPVWAFVLPNLRTRSHDTRGAEK